MAAINSIFPATAAAVAAIAFCALPASAADLKAEITTAATHAGLAAQAGDLAGVQMHLHHTLNCLEGPNGADFSKADINPCQNSGSGAIPDSDNPTTTATLETAVTEARNGLAAKTLQTAQGDASQTASTLKSIK